MSLSSFFLFAAAAFVLGLLLTPFVRRMALEWHLVDEPNARKVHRARIPRLGGVAIFAAFFITAVAIVYSDYCGVSGVALTIVEINKILDGGVLILLVGVYDDLFGLDALHKLFWQVAVAVVMIGFGYVIRDISIPGLAHVFHLGWFGYPVTVLWIVGVMNALNLIDGLDGLAAGLATIATALIFALALLNHQGDVAFLAAILVGSLLGFWVFNMNPASIFMGDSGSLFLGYILAVISIRAVQGAGATVAIGAPLLLIGLPLLDTGAAFIRRLVAASGLFQPDKPLHMPSLSVAFRPDRGHIHHRLLVAGFSQRQVVLLLYAVATFLGVAGFLLAMARGIAATLTVVYVAVVLGFIVIRVRRLTTHNPEAALPLPRGWREVVQPVARNHPLRRVAVVTVDQDQALCDTLHDVAPGVVCVPAPERGVNDYFPVVIADCREGDGALQRARELGRFSRTTVVAVVSPLAEEMQRDPEQYHGVTVVEAGDHTALVSAIQQGLDFGRLTAQNAFLKFFAWLLIALLPLVAYFSAHFWHHLR